jgi:hypothetical protein
MIALALVVFCLGGGCKRPQAAAPGNNGSPASGRSEQGQRDDHDHEEGDHDEHGREGEHEHEPGAHGGTIVPIGRDNYHAEAVFEDNGRVRLYTLGRDETKVQDVESQELVAYARPAGGGDSARFVLEPEPQAGDAPDRTSQFVGQLPDSLRGTAVQVTIPSIRINKDRFRLQLKSAVEHAEMPDKVADEAERELYLTSAGKYTNQDIEANGGVTASEKFKGFKAAHDLNPRPGDKICPITMTKANPGVRWIVDGQAYEFCCPPCVDEFVQRAKQDPQAIQEPEAYVKRE